MIQGSSIEPEIIEQINKLATNYERVLVCLDSNHTHEHVLTELEAYASLTTPGSYCVVFDTIVEDLPANCSPTVPGDQETTQKQPSRNTSKAILNLKSTRAFSINY